MNLRYHKSHQLDRLCASAYGSLLYSPMSLKGDISQGFDHDNHQIIRSPFRNDTSSTL